MLHRLSFSFLVSHRPTRTHIGAIHESPMGPTEWHVGLTRCGHRSVVKEAGRGARVAGSNRCGLGPSPLGATRTASTCRYMTLIPGTRSPPGSTRSPAQLLRVAMVIRLKGKYLTPCFTDRPATHLGFPSFGCIGLVRILSLPRLVSR